MLDLVRLEILLNLTQDRCTVCAERTIASKIILDTPDGTPRSRLKWKLDSIYSNIVLIFTQDRCTVCAERTTASEIVLAVPDGTPR
jgi:hypothetical protein